MSAPGKEAAPSNGGLFPTTHWSIVLEAGAERESEARTALERLCELYWFPLYAFVRRQGRSRAEAEDCTQAFLLHLLAVHGIAKARPERGRFRTFLLSSMRHFLINEWLKSHALKRGGGAVIESLDWEDAEHRYLREPVDPGISPEDAFDRAWALEMIDRSILELRTDYHESGRADLFEALRPVLLEGPPKGYLDRSAEALGMNKHALAEALRRLRRRLGRRLRAHVAETIRHTDDIDREIEEEVEHLIDVLRRSS